LAFQFQSAVHVTQCHLFQMELILLVHIPIEKDIIRLYI
jgi:hypothetical protein